MIRILQGGDGPATDVNLGGSVGSRSSASQNDEQNSDSDLELSSLESGSNPGSLPRNGSLPSNGSGTKHNKSANFDNSLRSSLNSR
jgi:hypothetical protein